MNFLNEFLKEFPTKPLVCINLWKILEIISGLLSERIQGKCQKVTNEDFYNKNPKGIPGETPCETVMEFLKVCLLKDSTEV